jgi:hypothetical protein
MTTFSASPPLQLRVLEVAGLLWSGTTPRQ